MSITVSEYKKLLKRKNKYHAISCEADGMKFPSKAERDYYLVLKEGVRLKHIQWFTRQVPLYLPGNVVLRIDFLVINDEGQYAFMDVKGGNLTESWRTKQKIAEALYPFKIHIVRRKEINEIMRLYGMK